MTSSRVFITNGPIQATGSRIGRPPRMRTSRFGAAALLDGVGRDRDRVARAEDRELARADRLALGADGALPGQHVDERVVVGPPRQRQPGARAERGVDHRHRRVGRARAGVAGDVAGDDPDQRAAVGRRDERDLARAQVLVARRGQLLGAPAG